MQLLIASALLVTLGAYLIRQFWTQTLEADDEARAHPEPSLSPSPKAEADRAERLKAA